SLLASGLVLTIFDGTLVILSDDLDLLDALHAEGALFHDATTAHRDFRIESHRLELGSWVIRPCVRGHAVALNIVVAVVEAPDLVGAVVRAIPGPDTAVVHHVVLTLAGVHCRADGANLLAGCVF